MTGVAMQGVVVHRDLRALWDKPAIVLSVNTLACVGSPDTHVESMIFPPVPYSTRLCRPLITGGYNRNDSLLEWGG